MTRLQERWKTTPVLIGTWLKVPSIFTLETTVQAGFDFLIVDMEHSYMTEEWLITACAVAQPYGVSIIVRTPDSSGRGLSRILDIGIDGILFPQLQNVVEAKYAIDGTIFQPQGRRGVGGTSRAGKWASIPQSEYMAKWDVELFRCIQFETKSSIDQMDEMLNIQGLTASFLGPADLSTALGVSPSKQIIDDIGTKLIKNSEARGLPCGTAVGSIAALEHSVKLGYKFILVSNDATVYNNAITKLAIEAKTVANVKSSK
jgi:2-keto-3-deoxy-L-rhamnonate aldolase RhmA